MKNTVSLVFLILLVACGGNTPADETTVPTETVIATADTTAELTAVPTETETATPELFTIGAVENTSLIFPTSLHFGPDGRLYVSQRDGRLFAYSVTRQDSATYAVTHMEQIDLIHDIPNHNDDGSFHNGRGRQLTGFDMAGSAENPILYVTSSDYREGGGISGRDYGLDTNSGIVSQLTCVGGVTTQQGCLAWEKVDLVRGLPRSEQNHATNGIQFSADDNKLYVAQGGFTDTGAPSAELGFTAETALSASILEIDLNKISDLPEQTDRYGQTYLYNLPTLNTITTGSTNNYDDPWGGNDGLNQAILEANSPVQLFATGFRNPFDLLLTESGRLYTADNGSNFDWGGYPEYEESYDCTNNYLPEELGSVDPGVDPSTYPVTVRLHDGENGTAVSDGLPDEAAQNIAGLHLLTKGYYGGHANPTRGNPLGAGIFVHDELADQGEWLSPDDPRLPASWPPVTVANPVECDFQPPAVDDGLIANLGPSTNGLTEYTASNLGNSLKGVILGASYTNDIFQIRLNGSGSEPTNCPASRLEPCIDRFASGFGAVPLDVHAVGDDGVFPGTVWVVNHLSGVINVFEPPDYTADQLVALPQGVEDTPLIASETEAATLPTAGEAIVCINAGGGEYQTNDGRLFLSDEATADWVRNGEVAINEVEIPNSDDDPIYHSERWGEMHYFVPVPEPGMYLVELYFAEMFYGVATDQAEGARSFNIELERAPILEAYDIAAVAGGATNAVAERFATTSFDATIDVKFIRGERDNPKLSGLCIFQVVDGA